MDFRSLIQKIESVDGIVETPKSPVLPKAVQLDEDIAMHVLAGTKTLTEAAELMEKKLTKAEKEKKEEVVKSMKKDKEGFEKRYGKRGEEVMHATATKIAKKTDESVSEEMKVGDKKKSATGGTIEKTATGIKHTAKDYDGEDHVEPAQKKASKAGMTGAERKEQAAKDKAEEKKGKEWEAKHGKGSVTRHKMEGVELDSEKFRSKFMQMVEEAKKTEKKMKGKKAEEKMDEAKKPDDDNDGVPNWADKKPGKDDNEGKKKSGKKEMSAKQEKYFGKKKTVKESIEPKLTFREMMKLVVESGGQQQIDPLDKTLFAWAQRVASTKFQESRKAEVYAGLVYERMGGRFEMYDVLSENLSEGRVQLDEGMLGKIKSFIMSKVAPKFSSEEQDKMRAAAQKVLGKSKADSSDFTLDNIKAVAKALGAKPPAAAESIEEGPMDMMKDASKKVSDFFGQKKVDPKSGKGTLGPVDAWHKDATLGEKIASVVGSLGGTAATIAGFFGGPGWLIIPGILGIMFLSQVGLSRSDAT